MIIPIIIPIYMNNDEMPEPPNFDGFLKTFIKWVVLMIALTSIVDWVLEQFDSGIMKMEFFTGYFIPGDKIHKDCPLPEG